MQIKPTPITINVASIAIPRATTCRIPKAGPQEDRIRKTSLKESEATHHSEHHFAAEISIVDNFVFQIDAPDRQHININKRNASGCLRLYSFVAGRQ